MLLLLKLLHIASVLALFAGLVGRAVTYRQAQQSTELAALVPLLEASGWFDRFLVIPGSMLVLLTGGALAGLAHWPFRTGSGAPTWLLVALLVYLSLVPVIAVVLVPRRRRREAAFHASIAARRLTNELASALADPVVTWARRYEWLVNVGDGRVAFIEAANHLDLASEGRHAYFLPRTVRERGEHTPVSAWRRRGRRRGRRRRCGITRARGEAANGETHCDRRNRARADHGLLSDVAAPMT